MPVNSKEIKPPNSAGIEKTIEEAEETAYWEVNVIFDGQKLIFRLACANLVNALLHNKPPFNNVEKLQENKTLAYEWALTYIKKSKRLTGEIEKAFRAAEKVFNREEGIMSLIPLTILKLSNDNLLGPTDPVDGILLSLLTGSTDTVVDDLKKRGTVAYPLFSLKEPLLYLLREDKLGEENAFVFSLVVADKQSLVEFLGDESLIRLLKNKL